MSETVEALRVIDQIVRWVTPLLAAAVSLAIYVYRAKVKELEREIKEEIKIRKEAINDVLNVIKEYEEDRKQADEHLVQAFKEGIREERGFRTEVMVKQAEHIEHIFESLQELNSTLVRINQKLISHIENQEKICSINHSN